MCISVRAEVIARWRVRVINLLGE